MKIVTVITALLLSMSVFAQGEATAPAAQGTAVQGAESKT